MLTASAVTWCHNHESEQINLLTELAAIPSPSHFEDRRVEWICRYLKSIGIDTVLTDEAKNVIIPMGPDNGEPYTVFAAHTDVVFPDMDPLPVRVENGILYAPGSGDDTANLTAILMCLHYLAEQKISLAHPLLFVLNSCEEGLGNLKGTRQLFQDYAGRIARFITFDGIAHHLLDTAVGSERWQVNVKTPGGHSYACFGNANAIAEASALISALYHQQVPVKPKTRTTYNVGLISGGTSVNTIAEDASFCYEYRSTDSACLARMRQQFFSLTGAADHGDISVTRELIGERPCANVTDADAQNALLQTVDKAAFDIYGTHPVRVSSSTDANIPLSLGVPATCIGLYEGALAHTREEYVILNTLNDGLKIALSLVLGMGC